MIPKSDIGERIGFYSYFRLEVQGPLAIPKKLYEGLQNVRIIFIVIACYLPFDCGDICTDGVQAMVDKTADTLVWIKAVTPDCIRGH